ncbi:MAG: hypothetical protein JOZ65_33480 [Chloroflexi bacterium]|nr:hypothetical protein [Chloroflexota bacterium]
MTTSDQPFPGAKIVRLSRGTFEPARYADIQQANRRTSENLVPAIRQLPGVQAYFAGISPSGSIVQVSFWDSEEHADQMSRLPEMVVRARKEFEGLDVAFIPIVNHAIAWRL